MNIIEAILHSKNTNEIHKKLKTEHQYRYPDESFFIFLLSSYALNKEKNKKKPNFETMELISIFTHLVSEVYEIKYELNQNKIDYGRVLDEIADCAGLLTGLVAYIIEHKEKE